MPKQMPYSANNGKSCDFISLVTKLDSAIAISEKQIGKNETERHNHDFIGVTSKCWNSNTNKEAEDSDCDC